ncbi:hydrolase [Streptomyces sulfonofaciens]|uniref:Hydrolase n=1 Tax=Streptomyces sulfonofaciens TaxID=68272 RepID=A0A919G606_9ACTN|nr:amidohydrolase family protein [Streptomyces sulfonofaciens]GHH78396.1 hydrolase [Streptomyces sulfonofaciens]
MPDSQPQWPPSAGRAGFFDGWGGAAGEGGGMLLSGARLADGRTVDVRLAGARIEAVGTVGSLGAPPGTALVDLDGYLLLPAPAEPHAHSDTALSAEADAPAGYEADDVQRRATEAALLQLGHGATALRSHVRIGEVHGLDALEAVLEAGRALRGLADLSVVAVPRVLTGAAGAEGLALLRDAVKMGASVVGGCPDADPDPAGYVEAVLDIAAEHGCPVDLHTDGDDPARLARLAAAVGGLRPGVAIGPCGGLGRLPAKVAARAAERLAAAGVTVVCLPQGGCGTSGPGGLGALGMPAPDGVPERTGVTERADTAPVRLLRAAGVRIAAGSGALRDTANPVGRGDPLEAAYLLASQDGLGPADAYDAVSGAARAALGLPEVRVEAGFPAELLAVRGRRLADVLSLAYSRVVIHRGRLVARISSVREYCDSAVAVALDLPRQGGRPRGIGWDGT